MKFYAAVSFLWLLLYVVSGKPVSQPVYSGTQYITAQLPPNFQAGQAYIQQITPAPQYLTANTLQQAPQPIYNDVQRAPQQFVPQQPTQRVSQLLLPTNVDRQVKENNVNTTKRFLVFEIINLRVLVPGFNAN